MMSVDDIRAVIAHLEPVMGRFAGSFVELEDEAEKLVDHIEETFHSDISDYEALLLAALVWRLRARMAQHERQLRERTDLGMIGGA